MSEDPVGPVEGERRGPTTAQKQLIAFILVLAVANIAYRLVYATGAQQTAALYVGVPTILAIGLTLVPSSGSATAALMKGATLAMLLACVILPEGLLCLIFAFPLVALISVVIGAPIDWSRNRQRRDGPTRMVVALPLLVLSLEGVLGSPFDAHDRATASITVDASPEAIAEALATPPSFETELPTFLTIGFNRPVGATGSGIEVGDQRTIRFAGGSHDDHPLSLFGLTDGSSADHHVQMHLRVVESDPGRVVFAIDHDLTMLARWTDLDHAVVTWEAIDATRTRVSWTLEYERLLFPTAYFAPVQRYGMDQAARYLLEAVIVEQLP